MDLVSWRYFCHIQGYSLPIFLVLLSQALLPCPPTPLPCHITRLTLPSSQRFHSLPPEPREAEYQKGHHAAQCQGALSTLQSVLCSAPPVLLYPAVLSTRSYILRFFLCYQAFLPRAEARLRASAPSQGGRQNLNPRYSLSYLLVGQMLTSLVDGGDEQFSNC